MLDKDRSREVRRQIQRVLMEEWDPIGVSDIPEAYDEYDSYIDGAYELLEAGASEHAIGAYLRNVEIERMGLVNESEQPLMPESNRDAAVCSLKRLERYFRNTTV